MSVLNFGLLAVGTAFLTTLSSHASAQEWKPGQIVLGSPTTIEAGYRRCQVMGGPDANGYYDMNCLQFYVDQRGKKVRSEGRTGVSRNWIKPDDPSFQPDMQFAAVRAAAAAPKESIRPVQQRATPAPAGGPAKPGSYNCVFFSNGMLQTVPGFTLTAAGYRHQNGGGGTTRRLGNVIEFVGGPLNGQAGKVGPKTIHLYNESRSRTVIDCDTK